MCVISQCIPGTSGAEHSSLRCSLWSRAINLGFINDSPLVFMPRRFLMACLCEEAIFGTSSLSMGGNIVQSWRRDVPTGICVCVQVSRLGLDIDILDLSCLRFPDLAKRSYYCIHRCFVSSAIAEPRSKGLQLEDCIAEHLQTEMFVTISMQIQITAEKIGHDSMQHSFLIRLHPKPSLPEP